MLIKNIQIRNAGLYISAKKPTLINFKQFCLTFSTGPVVVPSRSGLVNKVN
jgi:hypothetical protein